ncbi:MAG: response regulator transcription factor [Pseudomonas sp.]|nr:response regulator transcription factor [Pseudomonas sp.]
MNLLYIAQNADAALQRALTDSGYRVIAVDLDEAGWALTDSDYHFILLDLPTWQPEVVAHCFTHRGDARVLVLLEVDDKKQRIEALHAGAALCLSRPVAFVELLARMQALGREHGASQKTADNGLWFSTTRLLIGRGLRYQPLTVSEQRLLAILARRPGAVSRDMIEAQLWGEADDSRSALIERHICNLRRKLARLDAPNALQTLRGFGYSLRETVHMRTD